MVAQADPAAILFPSDAPGGASATGAPPAPSAGSANDPASILFPNDKPAGSVRAPEYFQIERASATARLMGRQGDAGSVVPRSPAGSDDPAEKLFPQDAVTFDEKPINAFFDGFAASAIGDGDKERADAFGQARDALVADAKEAGTKSSELSDALDIVRERQGDTVAGPVSEEKLARDMEASMLGLRAEFGERLDGDLAAAQAFIRDLDTVSPGVIRSLEATGAGNDPRLIRIAMREARRRGYA
jgi:hypothetical protein